MNIGDMIEVEIIDDKRIITMLCEIVDFVKGKKKKITHYIIKDQNGNRFIKSVG